jgi:antirestriction protein ArdC
MSLLLLRRGSRPHFWLTVNQARKLCGRIRKGAKSSPVIFWNVGEERETITSDGTKETSRPFLLRYYSGFNFSQAEGIDIPASLL